MSVCIVQSHPGRNCTGTALVWRRCGKWCRLDTDQFQNGRSQNRFPPIWPCVTCRSFGGGLPTPQQFPKNRAILRPEKAGTVTGVQSQDQSIQQCCGGAERRCRCSEV